MPITVLLSSTITHYPHTLERFRLMSTSIKLEKLTDLPKIFRAHFNLNTLRLPYTRLLALGLIITFLKLKKLTDFSKIFLGKYLT